MKKLSAILLTILICFSLTACQEDEKTAEQPVNQEETTQETIVEEDTKQEETTTVEETKDETTEEATKEETKEIDRTNLYYWVNFRNIDGSTLQRSTYKYGSTPTYNGETPTYYDGSYNYTFTGWDKKISPVYMTQIYTAVYSKTVIPAVKVVNPEGVVNLEYDGTAQELITAGSGATFTYSLDGGTYSKTTPTATNAGSYEVRYKKDGTDAGVILVTIEKRDITIETASDEKAYDGTPLTASEAADAWISAGSLADGDTYSVVMDTSITNVGSVTNELADVIFFNEDQDDVSYNYNLTKVEGTLIVTKATLAKDDLTFTAPTNLVYDKSSKSASFTNSKTHFGSITVKYATSITAEPDEWSTEPPKNAGTYYVKAFIDEDTNHNAVNFTDSSWTFTITKAKVDVPAAETGLVYNGTEQTGVTLPQGAKYTLSDNTATKPGLYQAIASLTDTANYEWNLTTPTTSDQTINWSIAKATPKVTAPTAKTDLVYTGSALELINAGSTTAGTLQYKLGTSGTYSTTIPTATNVGTYTVYYKVVGNDNYNDVAEASVDVTIDVTYTLTGSKVLKASALLATQSSVVTYNNGLCTAYNGYISATSGAKWAGATGFVKALNDAQVAPSGKTYGTGAGQGTWRLLCSNADAQAWVDATTNATSGFGGVYYLWSSMECDTNYAYTCGCFGVYCWKNYTKSFSNSYFGFVVVWDEDFTYTLTGSSANSKVLKASDLLATQSSVVTYNNGLCTAYNGYISATSGASWDDAVAFVTALNTAQVAPSGKTYGTSTGQGTWRLLSLSDAQAWATATTGEESGFGGVYYLWSSWEYNSNNACNYCCDDGNWYFNAKSLSNSLGGFVVVWAQNS